MNPRLLLDTNVWRAVVDEGAVEQLRLAARRAGVRIVAAPAVTYEALRSGDTQVRRAMVSALTRGQWIHPMPESFQEAQEVLAAIRRRHPEWLASSPDLRNYYKLRSDWKGGWRRRARKDPDAEARRIVVLDDGQLDSARQETKGLRKFFLENKFRFETLDFTETHAVLDEGTPGWDGKPFEAWRAVPLARWHQALRPSTRGADHDWLSPWIANEQVPLAAWTQFWTREVHDSELPLTWLRWAFEHVQATRAPTPGTPVDNQISVYLAEADYFITADKAFFECVKTVRDIEMVHIAIPILAKRTSAVEDVLSFLEHSLTRHEEHLR